MRKLIPWSLAVFAVLAATPGAQARLRPSRHRPVHRSCRNYFDSPDLVDFSKIRTTNLTCYKAQVVEKRFEPALQSGSGPDKPVKVDGFTCRAKLKLEPNRLTGPGFCTASHGRRVSFVATVYGQ